MKRTAIPVGMVLALATVCAAEPPAPEELPPLLEDYPDWKLHETGRFFERSETVRITRSTGKPSDDAQVTYHLSLPVDLVEGRRALSISAVIMRDYEIEVYRSPQTFTPSGAMVRIDRRVYYDFNLDGRWDVFDDGLKNDDPKRHIWLDGRWQQVELDESEQQLGPAYPLRMFDGKKTFKFDKGKWGLDRRNETADPAQGLADPALLENLRNDSEERRPTAGIELVSGPAAVRAAQPASLSEDHPDWKLDENGRFFERTEPVRVTRPKSEIGGDPPQTYHLNLHGKVEVVEGPGTTLTAVLLNDYAMEMRRGLQSPVPNGVVVRIGRRVYHDIDLDGRWDVFDDGFRRIAPRRHLRIGGRWEQAQYVNIEQPDFGFRVWTLDRKKRLKFYRGEWIVDRQEK